MHGTAMAIVPPDADLSTPDAVQQAVIPIMAPFSEHIDVDPYRVYDSSDVLDTIADHYQIDRSDVHALASCYPDWEECPGGVDEQGRVYKIQTKNPAGQWDYWIFKEATVAGAYRMARLADYPDTIFAPDRVAVGFMLAVAVLDPSPCWIQSRSMNRVIYRYEHNDRFLDILREIRRRLPGHYGVELDYHW